MGRYPIDRKERVTLGGLEQTIHIWGTKNENPVILFLHGGPGVPNRHDMAKNGFGQPDISVTARSSTESKTRICPMPLR